MKRINPMIVVAMLVSSFCGTAVAEEVACGAKACLTSTDPTTLENKYFEAELKCKTGVDAFGAATGWTTGSLNVTAPVFTLGSTSTAGENCVISGEAFGSGKTEVKCVDAGGYKVEAEIKAVSACDTPETE
jgi:hypothetical protein